MKPILPFILLLIFGGSHSSHASTAVQNGYPLLFASENLALKVVFRASSKESDSSATALQSDAGNEGSNKKILGQNEQSTHLWVGQSAWSRDGPLA
jgi:hypothetical protein